MSRINTPRPVDPLAGVNDPGEAFRNPAQLQFIRTLVDLLRRMSSAFIRTDAAAPHILLTSPNGTVYFVTVADDGTITTAPARG